MKIRIRSSFGNEISSSPKVRTWRQPLLSLSLSLTPGLPPSSLCTVSSTVSDSPRSWRTEATGHFRCARERNFRPSVSWTWPSTGVMQCWQGQPVVQCAPDATQDRQPVPRLSRPAGVNIIFHRDEVEGDESFLRQQLKTATDI